jgi:hypothetical protein
MFDRIQSSFDLLELMITELFILKLNPIVTISFFIGFFIALNITLATRKMRTNNIYILKSSPNSRSFKITLRIWPIFKNIILYYAQFAKLFKVKNILILFLNAIFKGFVPYL